MTVAATTAARIIITPARRRRRTDGRARHSSVANLATPRRRYAATGRALRSECVRRVRPAKGGRLDLRPRRSTTGCCSDTHRQRRFRAGRTPSPMRFLGNDVRDCYDAHHVALPAILRRRRGLAARPTTLFSCQNNPVSHVFSLFTRFE